MKRCKLLQCKSCGTRRTVLRYQDTLPGHKFFCQECYKMVDTVIEKDATEEDIKKYRYPKN